MATQITIETQLNYYKKRRNQFLFFIIIPVLVTITAYVLNSILVIIPNTVMDSIIFVIIIAFLFYVSLMKSKITVLSMYYEYFKMLYNEIGIQGFPNLDIIKQLQEKGYLLKQKQETFSIYQLVNIDTKSYYNKTGTMVVAIVMNNVESDLYDPKIQQSLETLYTALEKTNNHVLHQVTFIIKKYEVLNENAVEELQKIVNVQQGFRSLIQLNIGIDLKKNELYYLAPKKRYPNRMYYEAVNEIKRLFS